MLNIDDILELNKAYELIKSWTKRLDTAKSEYRDTENKEMHPAVKTTSLERNQEVIDRLTQGYEEAQSTFETLSEQKGIDGFSDFEYDVKRKFLEDLVSRSHISQMSEEPSVFFKKLIQLYGEDELANFSYIIRADGNEVGDNDWEEDYDDMEYYDREDDYDDIEHYGRKENYDDMEFGDDDIQYDDAPLWRKNILDFIYGEEDKIIELVKSDNLRSILLASKLMFMDSNDVGDIRTCFEEYTEKAKDYNTCDCAYFDDLGYIDYEDTLNNFGILPISDDKNFYLYILKHKQEMQISPGTLMQYIKSSLLKEPNFVLDMERVYSTGEYSYNPDYAYSPDIFKVLAQKKATRNKLESEAEKISQAEDLIYKQQKGQGKGE